MRKIFYIFIVMPIMLVCACEPDEPEVPKVEPIVESVSVTEGAEVAVELSTITIVYSVPVRIAENTISLGNVSLEYKVTNKVLTISLGPLEYETNYSLVIPQGAIINSNDKTPASSFSVSFRTEKKINPNPEIPVKLDFRIDESPINPKATIQAKKVYSFLRENFGKKTLSGTMANVNWGNTYAEWVYDKTGKWTALTCYDFVHYTHQDDTYASEFKSLDEGGWVDYEGIVRNATDWWNEGGLVSIMWHWHDPSRKTNAFYCKSDGQHTTFDVSNVFDKDSEEYKAMISDIDIIAEHLKKLQEAGVPVLWRPLHEAEGSVRWGAWFWWGNGSRDRAAACVELWRVMYDRLVNYHSLNNLLWVWTVNIDDYDYLWYSDCKSWYPGDEYVDIIGIDIYDDVTAHSSHLKLFKQTALVADLKKIVTLSECGHIPDPEMTMKNSEMWSWWMPWYGNYTTSSNYNGDYWFRAFSDLNILTRDMLPNFK